MSRKFRVVLSVVNKGSDIESVRMPAVDDAVTFHGRVARVLEVEQILSAEDALAEIEKELSVALEWPEHSNELAAIEAARIERMRETIVRYRASQEKP